VQRLNESGHVSPIAERRAKPSDGGVQAVLVIHERPVRPQARAELVARHYISRALQQGSQHTQRLFLKRQANARLAELSRLEIDLERTKPHNARPWI
jgi:hypothetical protein